MLVQSLSTTGFLGRERKLEIAFQPDLNIITGYNGAGKTNLLKLLWYTISGNISALLKEVAFRDLTLTTSDYQVYIFKQSENTCRGHFLAEGKRYDVEDIIDSDNDVIDDARDQFSNHLSGVARSIFFPTFRRIEGGFTIDTEAKSRSGIHNPFFQSGQRTSELQESVLSVARRLTNGDHTFITSISTIDIAELLMKRYTEMSEHAANAVKDVPGRY